MPSATRTRSATRAASHEAAAPPRALPLHAAGGRRGRRLLPRRRAPCDYTADAARRPTRRLGRGAAERRRRSARPTTLTTEARLRAGSDRGRSLRRGRLVRQLRRSPLRSPPASRFRAATRTSTSASRLARASTSSPASSRRPPAATGGLLPTPPSTSTAAPASGNIGRRPAGFVAGRRARGAPLGRYFSLAALPRARIGGCVRAAPRALSRLRRAGGSSPPRPACGRRRATPRPDHRPPRAPPRRSGEAPSPCAAAQLTFEAFVLENAVEGCVRETFGALLAMHQRERAADPGVRGPCAASPQDETRHAELAWAIHRWALPRLSRGRQTSRSSRPRDAPSRSWARARGLASEVVVSPGCLTRPSKRVWWSFGSVVRDGEGNA